MLMAGCGPAVGNGGASGSGSGSGSGAGISGEVTASSTTADSTATAETAADGTTEVPSDTTGEPVCQIHSYIECDPLDPEECGDSQECTPDYHPKGGDGWICGCDLGELPPFEECERSLEPGDDCAWGQLCEFAGNGWPPMCLPLCGSGLCVDEAGCTPGSICYPPCDPLGPDDCVEPLHCQPGSNRFECRPSYAIQPEPVGEGEPCTGSGGCEHGLLCVAPNGGECAGDTCCAAVCDASAMDPCPAGQACELLFDEPGPGSESLGVCR